MNRNNYKHSEITSEIIRASFEVHKILGHGFLETVYERSLAFFLKKEGFKVQCQHPISVFFLKELVGKYYADLLIEDVVIVELKAVETLHPKHEVQLVNYLKATEVEVGLLINFADEVQVKRKVFSNDRK